MNGPALPAFSPAMRCPLPVALCVALVCWLASSSVHAQDRPPLPLREATLEWNAGQDELQVSALGFRDVITSEIRKKLTRGLPTTIVFTATLHRPGTEGPVATTAQSCKVTWHVWHEAYRIEVTRPGSTKTRWTTEVEGVLRRCAEIAGLLIATPNQVGVGNAVFIEGKVQVNPIGEDLLKKIKRWVSRPARTGTAAPGDALFSTFTGLFMQRIGSAEKTLEFRSRTQVPKVQSAPEPERTGSDRNEG